MTSTNKARVASRALAGIGTCEAPAQLLRHTSQIFNDCLERGITVCQWHAEQNARLAGKPSHASKEAKPGGFVAFIARLNAAKLQTPLAAADEAKPATGFASKLRLPGKRR